MSLAHGMPKEATWAGDEGKGIRREGGKEGLIQKAGTAGGDGARGGCHGVNGLVRSFGRDDSSEARERAERKVPLDDEDDDGGFWRENEGISDGGEQERGAWRASASGPS